MGPLWPTLLTVVALVTAMAALPWLLRRFQQRTAALRGAAGLQSRVVTVEVGEGAQTVRLVLGVTAQSIQCLHVLQAPAPADFSAAMAQARSLPADGANV